MTNFSCSLIPVTFAVEVTHFIDASPVYGSTEIIASSLRSFTGGKLKLSWRANGKNKNEEFCPQRRTITMQCDMSPYSKVCYDAGDIRVNQNLGNALIHNIMLRFHNFVATQLQNLNKKWVDETLYQETRRMVGAITQHITYHHFLPIILASPILITIRKFFLVIKPFVHLLYFSGETYMKYYGLLTPITTYNDLVNPSTSQEFSTSSYSILHNLIPAKLHFINDEYQTQFNVNLTDWMNIPDLLPQGQNVDWLLRGLVESSSREYQSSYNSLISNHLFRFNIPDFIGRDLLATDIQRGRDVGLPTYNQVRPLCGIPQAKTFEELLDIIPLKAVQKLKDLYSSVDDIDLHVGSLLETPEEGSMIGPTSRCILSDSFYRYKVGDRFFYDVLGQPGSFTPKQLQTIKQINFGHIICATTNIKMLPLNVFKISDRYSPVQWTCNEHFTINFEAWKE